MLSLWDILRIPSTRVPLGLATGALYLLPPTACNFAIGLLAMKPGGMRAVRIPLWLIHAFTALRAAVGVDVSFSNSTPKLSNAVFAVGMFSSVVRALDFALTEEPLVRHTRPANSVSSILIDALDLTTNCRGIGWNWSHGLRLPRETRPTNRIAFSFRTFLSAALHAFMSGVLHQAVLSFIGVGSTIKELTIFDDSLPFLLQYPRACIISALTALIVYASMQTGYELYTVLTVLALRDDPASWPPLFDSPWRATSLAEFWGRRWHQVWRRVFLALGGRPLSVILGGPGIVLGAFLLSALVHDLFLLSIDSKAEPWRMFVGFGMMGPLVLAERAFYKATGKKVDGVIGRVWTMTWLTLLGSWMVEGIVRAGGLGDVSLIDGVVPLRDGVDRLVGGFDGLLHPRL